MRRRKQLERRLHAAELMYAQDDALLDKLNNNTPKGVDLQARANSLREFNAAHQSDLQEIVQLKSALGNMPPETAVQRLGDVLYWLGYGLAAVCIGAGALLAANVQSAAPLIFFGVVAVAIWLVGRACRYVLAGE